MSYVCSRFVCLGNSTVFLTMLPHNSFNQGIQSASSIGLKKPSIIYNLYKVRPSRFWSQASSLSRFQALQALESSGK
jgi:hypothetical protein